LPDYLLNHDVRLNLHKQHLVLQGQNENPQQSKGSIINAADHYPRFAAFAAGFILRTSSTSNPPLILRMENLA